MGALFTAEFLAEVGDPSRFGSADALAPAATIPPPRRSGGASFRWRVRRGNRTPKNLLYRSAFGCNAHHEPSRTYYPLTRSQGEAHHGAVISPARRGVNAPWAMLRDGRPRVERPAKAA